MFGGKSWVITSSRKLFGCPRLKFFYQTPNITLLRVKWAHLAFRAVCSLNNGFSIFWPFGNTTPAGWPRARPYPFAITYPTASSSGEHSTAARFRPSSHTQLSSHLVKAPVHVYNPPLTFPWFPESKSKDVSMLMHSCSVAEYRC